jgi:4,5-dihydroxyphthalate decarboxylase
MAAAGEQKPFTIGIGQRYDSLYLRNGTVRVEGFHVEFPEMPAQREAQAQPELRVAGDQAYVPPRSMFTAMATQPIYDIGEQAFSTFFQAVDYGKDIVALPVFPSRLFPHHEIAVNVKSGIQRPADLVGKRVAIPFFTQNHVVWLRGALQHQYGVPLEEVVWVEQGEEHFPEYRPPARFRVEKAPPGQSPAALLEAHAVDAALAVRGVRSDSPDVRPLLANPYAEIDDYVRATPIFPINTVLTLPRATLARSADFPRAVFDAFQGALRLYLDRFRDGTREDEHSGLYLRRLEGETRARYPEYGFKANRQTIETMIQYCYEQGVMTNRLDAERIFLLTDT